MGFYNKHSYKILLHKRDQMEQERLENLKKSI